MKLAIDLGGTNIRAALVTKGQIIQKEQILCPANQSQEKVLEALYSLIEKLLTDQVDGIGIGVPSVVDSTKGIVYDVANIPSWICVPLKEILEERYHVPVFVNNDANCFALGERTFGAGKDCSNLVGITLGTGLGCGLVLNGELYNGSNTGAGEVGCIPYLDKDFEFYCSTPFFAESLQTSAQDVYQLAQANNEEALMKWQSFGEHVGTLCKALLFMYDPDVIVFGGGISAAFPFFIQTVQKSFNDFPYKNIAENIRIEVSADPNISLLGAASLCYD